MCVCVVCWGLWGGGAVICICAGWGKCFLLNFFFFFFFFISLPSFKILCKASLEEVIINSFIQYILYVCVLQLLGNAICGSGSWPHNEEEETHWKSHCLFVLPVTQRAEGLGSQLLLYFLYSAVHHNKEQNICGYCVFFKWSAS